MMDSSTFKRFTASIENILDNLEDMDFTAFGKIILIYIYFVNSGDGGGVRDCI